MQRAILLLIVLAFPLSTFAIDWHPDGTDLYQDGIIYDHKDLEIFIRTWKSGDVIYEYCVNDYCVTIQDLDLTDFADFSRYWLSVTVEDLALAARDAADAGIEHGVARMISAWDDLVFKNLSEIENYVASVPPTSHQFTDPNCGAEYIYSLETIASEDKDHDFEVAKLRSVGSAAGVERAVSAKLWLMSEFNAIGAEHGISIRNSGELFNIPHTAKFKIQTNSTNPPPYGGITLMNGLCIPGEIVVGPGGDTDVVIVEKKDVIIENGTRAAYDYMHFTTPTPPPLEARDFEVDPADPNVFYIDTDGMYPPILLDAGQILEIRGNNGIDDDGFPIPLEAHITGDIILKGGSEILITEQSAVELYVDSDILVMVNADIEYEGAADQKTIYGETPPEGGYPVIYENYLIETAKSLTIYGTETCTDIEFNNGADLYALVSAPFADIRMKTSGDFYGAVVASNSLMMDNSAAFFFIASLFDFAPIEILSIGIKPGSWAETLNYQDDSTCSVFKTIVRKSSYHYRDTTTGPDELYVYYYSDPANPTLTTNSPMPDSFAKFYRSSTELMVDYGTLTQDYINGEVICQAVTSSEMIVNHVTNAIFLQPETSYAVQMILTLNNGQQVSCTAIPHN